MNNRRFGCRMRKRSEWMCVFMKRIMTQKCWSFALRYVEKRRKKTLCERRKSCCFFNHNWEIILRWWCWLYSFASLGTQVMLRLILSSRERREGFSTLLTLLFEALLNQMMKCELTNFIEPLFFSSLWFLKIILRLFLYPLWNFWNVDFLGKVLYIRSVLRRHSLPHIRRCVCKEEGS